MRYTLLLHHPEATPEQVGEEAWKEAEAAFEAYIRALDDAGVLAAAEILQPVANATTLTLENDQPRVQDGPYADTKERLGGIFVLDVPDLDAALAWAEKCPAAHWGTVEIRPTAVHAVDGAWVPAE
ncbi:MAG: YciI family protein [Gemmatimonadota bacterium]